VDAATASWTARAPPSDGCVDSPVIKRHLANEKTFRLLLLAFSSAPSPPTCILLGSLSSSSRAPSDPYLPCAWLKQIHLNLLRLIPEEHRAVESELYGCGSWRGLDPLPIQDSRQALSQGATRLCQLGERDKCLGGPFTPKDSSEALEPSGLADRFFRVDESFRASTRAGLTRARSLNAWVYSERNAVTHLPGLPPSYRVSCEQESVVSKNQEKKEKIESRKTSVRKNTPFSVLRSQNALKTPRLRLLKC
jgi:hypothetical protein